jgi:hypothetical protein
MVMVRERNITSTLQSIKCDPGIKDDTKKYIEAIEVMLASIRQKATVAIGRTGVILSDKHGPEEKRHAANDINSLCNDIIQVI